MCHDIDSRPPAPPRSRNVAERGTLTLTSTDGTRVAAAYAAPAAPAAPAQVGVVLLPDIRGLHPYYAALAERFAQAGLPALAVDWFGRTAELPAAGTRDQDFDWQTHIPQVTAAGVDADVAAAVGYLRERTRPDLPVVTVGFCFGGSHSWRLAGSDLDSGPDVAACVGFYGKPERAGDAPAVRPTLMVIAGADAAPRSTPSWRWPSGCGPVARRCRPPSTTAPRTPSSTAPTASGRRRARTSGAGCSPSPTAWPPADGAHRACCRPAGSVRTGARGGRPVSGRAERRGVPVAIPTSYARRRE